MKYTQDTFIWSENWWIEEDKAWFVEQTNNILFYINLRTGICEDAIEIPDHCANKYKLTPYCVKCGNAIFCIPGRGKNIWVYHLADGHFSKISLDKPEGVQWAFEIWSWQDKIFLVSICQNKIFEVDISQGRITNLYIICDDNIVGSAIVGNSIFMISSKSDRIYQFDCITKCIKSYTLPKTGKKFYNISYDGKRFLLCGYSKEIYAWDFASSQLTIIDNFPKNFKVYNLVCELDSGLIHNEIPLFIYEKAVGKYVWFIPEQANKIVYINKENSELKTFEIAEIDETSSSWTTYLPQYLWEYVRDDRYIGLFSARNHRVLEIDTKDLKYQWKDYKLGNSCMQQCDKTFKGIYIEGDVLHNKIYNLKLRSADWDANNLNTGNIGSAIFNKLKENEYE